MVTTSNNLVALVLLLVSVIVTGKPTSPDAQVDPTALKIGNFPSNLETKPIVPSISNLPSPINQQSELYLLLVNKDEASGRSVEGGKVVSEEARVAKRSVEDLETAAGTNVLRPLFVYRQQLAYRERVRGANRRSGIRPRF